MRYSRIYFFNLNGSLGERMTQYICILIMSVGAWIKKVNFVGWEFSDEAFKKIGSPVALDINNVGSSGLDGSDMCNLNLRLIY